jgi:hypothetical protein
LDPAGVFGPNSRLFGISFLVTSLEFLYPGNAKTRVLRYLLYPEAGNALEFVSKASGEALTPKLGFLEHLLPQAEGHTDQEMPFFASGTYLGQSIRKIEVGTDVHIYSTEGVKQLVLDEEILIGTSRPFRDTGVERQHPAGHPWKEDDDDYEYTQLTDQDYQRMINAGMNIFRVPGDHLEYVLEEPVFFLIRENFENSPELLYRSNFFGSVMYMDEPAWLIMSNHLAEQMETPRSAANLLCELSMERFEGRGNYGQRDLQKLLSQSGYVFSGFELLQPDYPCWETVASSAWYELESGIKGWCFESRLQPNWFANLVKDVLDVAFPNDPECCIQYHLGLFSGAAGRFDARWGVAIYGQTEARAAELLFPMAYQRGASYFWFWTSDRAHHVPFEEQLEHSKSFRKYVSENPKGPTKLPTTALSFPWGYLCDQYTLNEYYGHGEPRMWFSKYMGLNTGNSSGVSYGQVLAAGMKQAANLLTSKTPFDILFLKDGETASEYRTVLQVNEDATVDQIQN